MGCAHVFEEMKAVIERMRKQVESLYPDLSVFVLLHSSAQRSDRLLLERDYILEHPAGRNTITLFQKHSGANKSDFHGLGTSIRKNFLSMKSVLRYQAAISFNVDEFDDEKEATIKLYTLFCEAMDFAVQQRKINKLQLEPTLVPKNLFKARVRQNLRSEIFACVLAALDGAPGAIEREASRCAHAALSAKAGNMPEENPFILAAQTVQFAYDNVFRDIRHQVMPVLLAHHIAKDIESTLDETALKSWHVFSSAAQEMAWQGYSEVNIINAALFSAKSHHVRAIAHLVAEMADVRTSALQLAPKLHNPFSEIEENEVLHFRLTSDAFEKAVTKGIEEGSARPLFDLANEQNAILLKGKIIGWCASGLQAAGKAFEGALSSGREPLQSAWLEFEGHKSKDVWQSLQGVAKAVIRERRSSRILGFDDLKTLLSTMSGTQEIGQAIQTTLDDPRFVLSQAQSHQLHAMPTRRPGVDFAPSSAMKPLREPAAVSAPQQAHTYGGPSLGLGSGSGSRFGGAPAGGQAHSIGSDVKNEEHADG